MRKSGTMLFQRSQWEKVLKRLQDVLRAVGRVVVDDEKFPIHTCWHVQPRHLLEGLSQKVGSIPRADGNGYTHGYTPWTRSTIVASALCRCANLVRTRTWTFPVT